MSSTTAARLAPGDEVVLARMHRWNAEAPEIQGTGRVTKIGRRYAFAEIDGGRPYEFDMDTGYGRGDDNHNGSRTMTPAQFDLEQRARDAEIYLREHGLERNHRGHLAEEHLIAMADLVRSFYPEEQDR